MPLPRAKESLILGRAVFLETFQMSQESLCPKPPDCDQTSRISPAKLATGVGANFALPGVVAIAKEMT